MPKQTKTTDKTTKRRTEVKDLPKGAKKMKGGEMKKVKGGIATYDLKLAKK